MEARTEERTAVTIDRFPAPPADIDLRVAEVPAATPEQRDQMRRNLEREIFIASQERDYLAKDRMDVDPDAVPTTVKQVSDVVAGRARAMNPFRDFNRIGAGALFNVDDAPCTSGLGIFTGIIAGTIACASGASFPIVVGAAALAAAPIFLPMWAGRTVFNLAAGILTAAAAPFLYAAARVKDVVRFPGLLAAKEFLKELSKSGMTTKQQYDKKEEKIAELDQAVEDAEKALGQDLDEAVGV